jgi:hypothetical protein
VRSNRLKIALDGALAVTLVLLYDTRAVTGLSFHEWAGIVIGAVFVLHVALSWNWVTAVTRRFFGRTTARSRAVYVLDVLILVAMSWTILSGVLISRVALPGLADGADPVWRQTHRPASWLTLLLVGIHLGLNWRWVMDVVRRLFRLARASLATVVALRALAAAVFIGGLAACAVTGVVDEVSRLAAVRQATPDRGGEVPDRPGRHGGPGRGRATGMPGDSGEPGRAARGGGGTATGSILLLGSGVMAATAVPAHYLDQWFLAARRRRRPRNEPTGPAGDTHAGGLAAAGSDGAQA